MEAPLRILLQHLDRNRASTGASDGDAELLERFVRNRDEAAFELLVWRHGTMVYNVCRRVLRDTHAAEDAFQATFLVLVRKAASIGRRQALAGWLHRVAGRVALRARSRPVPRTGAEVPEPWTAAPDALVWRDLRPVLDEEVGRLPEKYRLPVILCYLSGLPTDEAARRLGVPRGTVLSRLAWARQRLRTRLALRGVTLSAALLGGLLAAEAAPASAVLVGAASRAALSFAAGQPAAAPAAAVTLMEGVLRDMVMTKVKNALLVVLGLAVVGLGAGLWLSRPVAAEPVDHKREEVRPPATPAPKETVRIPEAPRPLGVWERDLALDESSVHITLQIEANRILATYKGPLGDKPVTLLIGGEYSVTRDYVLYGVVTRVEVPEVKSAKPGGDGLELAYLLMDHPFSLRYRLDDNALTIKAVNLGLTDLQKGDNKDKDTEEVQLLLCGRYKKKATGGEETLP